MVHLNFAQIFTGPENILWFLSGVGSVQIWQWIKAKYKDWRYPARAPHHYNKVNWLYVAIAVTFMITTFIGVQNQQTYDYAVRLGRDTQACQTEFNTILRVRSEITADNDKWSQTQRTAIATWLHEILFPPAEIAVLPIDDPKRQAWGLWRTEQADRIINEAERQQKINQDERNRHPLPEPTCGR